MSNTEARGPGRPPKQTQSIGASFKKGKPVWKEGDILDVVDKEPGYRYRWAIKDSGKLAKKERLGWEYVSGIQADNSKHIESGRIDDGKQLTSIREMHDCVLMRLPEELAQARDEYINNKTEQRTRALTAHIKDAAQKEGAETHGEITISSRKGAQIIE